MNLLVEIPTTLSAQGINDTAATLARQSAIAEDMNICGAGLGALRDVGIGVGAEKGGAEAGVEHADGTGRGIGDAVKVDNDYGMLGAVSAVKVPHCAHLNLQGNQVAWQL